MIAVKFEAGMTELERNLIAYDELRRQHSLLNVQVPKAYEELLREEYSVLGHTNGPLHRIVYPSTMMLNDNLDQEYEEFVDDAANSLAEIPGVIHKYADRILLLTTGHCHGHCMYCFRQNVLGKNEKEHFFEANSMATLGLWLQQHPSVTEVILSGGDPLTMQDQRLKYLLSSLHDFGIKNIRVHTRTPLFHPQRLTEPLIDLFVHYKVRMVIHAVHPYEISASVKDALQRCREKGLRMYNQFPLLSGINDHPTVLAQLIEELDNLHVRTLSIYTCDPNYFSSAFRVPLARVKALMHEFFRNTPSWINGIRVCQDSPYGKLHLEDLMEINSAGQAIFHCGNKIVQVPDLPDHHYQASELQQLLWR